ncbi:hypothetical protein BcepSauron_113 [Burkholderia phage BcepSauron]|uniref:Uncharacterized protein n=2 Tax=Sarumanvirus TaxID=2843450 RepID=A0A482MMW0_9CAUD|nr:hypothetical protein H1O16_gp114 [Burkholderia phage BcepSaruman]YP_009904491.1 hypothetical protein H1O17_gp113 [Burkholderia phage BcepSauron]QBQ74493.1 hypothetical protein BcepSauron_113 [Burkholderia phage BcepSauron]QBX06527.1 hypothetical protein BcepSaruman_114 [Burkholderia phage BcepSaruman]
MATFEFPDNAQIRIIDGPPAWQFMPKDQAACRGLRTAPTPIIHDAMDCAINKFPKSRLVPVRTEDGRRSYVSMKETTINRIKELAAAGAKDIGLPSEEARLQE